MSERILVCVAWPYANGSVHVGQMAGCFLPADIFARYHRIKGNEVLMVSGSDQHGTPVTIKAEVEGKTPNQIVDFYHKEFLDTWRRFGISFDLFTNTGTANHAKVAQDVFLKLLEKGYIYKDTVSQAFCEKCQRFLPDRYVEGTCPFCKSPNARGDQCEACGKPLNPQELIGGRCRLCGTAPVYRDSEHFFLKLTAFNEPLLKWIRQQSHWRLNVMNFTSRYLEEGLKDRAITRDIEWGVPVPVKGYEHKRLYVWFEAVIGYLSATKEWTKSIGDEEKWRDFWQKECRSYYFIGKDNIAFHTIIWPAMLMGYGGLNLPFDVPANEFLTIEGKKVSTSRNWAVWMPDYLDNYAPDPLRYLLSAFLLTSTSSIVLLPAAASRIRSADSAVVRSSRRSTRPQRRARSACPVACRPVVIPRARRPLRESAPVRGRSAHRSPVRLHRRTWNRWSSRALRLEPRAGRR